MDQWRIVDREKGSSLFLTTLEFSSEKITHLTPAIESSVTLKNNEVHLNFP